MKIIYRAYDGREFNNETDCLRYENIKCKTAFKDFIEEYYKIVQDSKDDNSDVPIKIGNDLF